MCSLYNRNAWNINWNFEFAAFPLNGLLISLIILLDFCHGISVLDRFGIIITYRHSAPVHPQYHNNQPLFFTAFRVTQQVHSGRLPSTGISYR